MHKQKSQAGFVQLLVAVMLLIILIGLLSYIYWQKSSSVQTNSIDIKKDETTSITNKDTTGKTDKVDEVKTSDVANDAELSELITDKYNNTGLTLKYPKSWTVKESTVGDSNEGGVYSINISSQDKQVTVGLSISNNPQYGVGVGSDSGSIVRVLEKNNIAELDDIKFISYAIKLTSEAKLIHVAGLFKDGLGDNNSVTSDDIFIGSGAGNVSIYSINHAPFFGIDSKGNDIRLNIINNSATDDRYRSNVYSTDSEIDSFINTENYKIAKQIAQSLYIK